MRCRLGCFVDGGIIEKGGGDKSSLMLFQICSMSKVGIQGGEAHICSKFPIVPYRIWPNRGPTLTETIGT